MKLAFYRISFGLRVILLAPLAAVFAMPASCCPQVARETPWLQSPSRPGVYFARLVSSNYQLEGWRGLAEQLGTSVASFETPDEDLLIGSQILMDSEDSWMGLTRASDNDAWTWETGVVLNYPLNLVAVDPGDQFVTGVRNGSVRTYIAWNDNKFDSRAVLEAKPLLDCDGDGEHDPIQLFLDSTNLDWDADGKLDVCEEQGTVYCASSNVNSVNKIGAVRALGSVDVAQNDLILFAYDLPPGVFGYWIISMTQGFIPDLGGGLGTLCLGGQIIRFNVPPYGVFQVPASGRVQTALDMAQIPQVGAINPGETWNFQVWHRDLVNNELTHNTTEAIEISFQ